MNVYLVRKGSNQVALVTLSKRRAIARAAKLANDAIEHWKGHREHNNYELYPKTTGSDAKIWCRILYRKDEGGTKDWLESFWVQGHQLHEGPIEMLADAAE